MKKLLLTVLILLSIITSSGQEITLTFTAKDASNQSDIDLSSVLIENQTHLCDTIVFGPNPSLVLPVSFGVPENNPGGLRTFRIVSNMPNPFSGKAIVKVCLPEGGSLHLSLSDIKGNILAEFNHDYSAGLHNFEIKSGYAGIILLNVFHEKELKSVKLINVSNFEGTDYIKYAGQDPDMDQFDLKSSFVMNDDRFLFNLGDQLKYTANATGYNDGIIQDSPAADTTYTFQLSEIVTLPTVLTSAVTDTTQTTATCGGNVTDDGGDPVTARGVCWSTAHLPTIENDFTIDDSGTGPFISHLTGLMPNTPYYIRAYATNSVNTGYGDEIEFETLPCGSPVVITGDTAEVTPFSFKVIGNDVTNEGGCTVTAKGICWSTSPYPTTASDTTIDGSGIGEYTSNITGLAPGTWYYVRAYAINDEDTAAYGDQIIVPTPQNVTTPTVTTNLVTDTTQTTATCGGNVTDDGGNPVTVRGVCWSISPGPTTEDNCTFDGSGTGEFTSYITGLTPGTDYYVRAYATNSLGTAYGAELFFTTALPDELWKLAGDTSKIWKLIRVVSTGRYPIEVGPYDHSTIWWAMGYNNVELANRPCMLNDVWTFYPDGTMEFEADGDYWAEGGVFDPANFCASTSEPMININGENCSAWGNGTHQFELIEGFQPKLKAIGNGAYIGFFKCANDYEVYDLDPMVQDEITYNVVKLSDAEAGTDTLIVELNYFDQPGDINYLGYWRHVLVHYDDPADEPPIPTPMPSASFTYSSDGFTVTFINTSTYAVSYLWDFDDGATSTEENPTHTYAAEGNYMVTLTAYNTNGENSVSNSVIVTTGIITEEILTAGPWKLQVTDHACYVGPGMGSDGWWITPLANLDGTMVGTPDDWSCMTDDEFIFSTGGGYEYKTNGGSRNDGYMGAPNGCWSDAEIAASPGAPFGSCNTHTFEFTPAIGQSRPIITLTNGPGYAAFIGFMKGYYGGENSNGANPPNGGNPTNRYEVIAYANTGDKEILIVTVDISSDHSGSAAWTMELERSNRILTEEILTAGPWKLQVTDHACYVGPGMGSDGWWITPLEYLDGTMVGTPDDWSCMTDDEFIFFTGGGYEYKTNGGSRNDGYMGTPNGCWSDAEIAASPGAPFGSCNTHTFEFTPAIGQSRPVITLTNGPGYAAFIGFMKGYYGGENSNGANPPNGGNPTNRYEVISYGISGEKEFLIVSVDITADHSGSAAWTMELER